MQQSNWRLYSISLVTLLCIWLILPTARYLVYITGDRPAKTGGVYSIPAIVDKKINAGTVEKALKEGGLSNLAVTGVWLGEDKRYRALIQTASTDEPSSKTLAALSEALTKKIPEAKVELQKPESAFDAWLDKADSYRVKAIPLGLDIQGGVDIVLDINLVEAEKNALKARQSEILKAFAAAPINAAVEISTDAQGKPGLDISVADPTRYRLAVNTLDAQTKGTFEAWNRKSLETTGKVRLTLDADRVKTESQLTIDGAMKVIRERVDVLGVTQASVSLQGNNRIRVQIPGERDPDKVIKNIIRPAVLTFHLVHKENDRLRGELFDNGGRVLEGQQTAPLKPGAQVPPGYKILPGEDPSARKTTAPGEKAPRIMYIVKEEPSVEGKYLVNAFVTQVLTDLENPIQVNVEFNKEGARIFREVTREDSTRADTPGRQLAIVLEDVVFSAPVLQTEIPDGRAVITGRFSNDEARDLSLVLKAGALPADLKPGTRRTVEATLGADSIKASLQALVIGSIVIMAFMIMYYSEAGVVAVLALILNILLVIAIMALSRSTLTVSGIGGILLTVGMAVDTNILIYERMREELASGKPMKVALAAGFHRVLPVIIDSHLTVLLTALILLQFGEGSVKGFALAMAFGLTANLYTGLVVTYALCEGRFRWKHRIKLGTMQLLRNPKIPFIALRGMSFSISGAMILASIIVLTINKGPNFAVDFKGGILSDVVFTGGSAPSTDEIATALAAHGASGARAQFFGDSTAATREALIRVPLIGNDTEKTIEAFSKAMDASFPKKYENRGSQAVTSEVGQEFSKIAWVIVACASFAILVYLWGRFELIFGVAAVLALVHDLFITLGFLTMIKIDVSLDVVSGLMILLGFSVNDTIVIFDRIRENARESYGKSLKELCDDSMNQTLTRTIITSLTVFFAMFCMYFLGGTSLRPLAITMLFGSIVGSYSTGFIAAPMVYEWVMRRRGGKLALAPQNAGPGGRRRGEGREARRRAAEV